MIGRLHHLVIDCPDPFALATFYSGLLGQPVTAGGAVAAYGGAAAALTPFAGPARGKQGR